MHRPHARRVLAAGLLIGLLAELVLDGPASGVNVPLVVIALLAAAWLVRRPGRAPDPLDAWLPVVAIVSAGFVAVRGDPFLAFLDTMVALLFTGASMVAFSGLPVTRRSASVVAGLGLWAVGAVAWGPPRMIAAARPARATGRRRAWADDRRRLPAWAGPVGRGSAHRDPARGRCSRSCSRPPTRSSGAASTRSSACRSTSGRCPGASCSSSPAPGSRSRCCRSLPAGSRRWSAAARWVPPPVRRPIDRLRGLGALEALVILLVIDLVVATFVGLQLAYLFGGLDTLAAIGMTYSDYARRGFFELVAAACLAVRGGRRPRDDRRAADAGRISRPSSRWSACRRSSSCRRPCASGSTRTPTAGPSCACTCW